MHGLTPEIRWISLFPFSLSLSIFLRLSDCLPACHPTCLPVSHSWWEFSSSIRIYTVKTLEQDPLTGQKAKVLMTGATKFKQTVGDGAWYIKYNRTILATISEKLVNEVFWGSSTTKNEHTQIKVKWWQWSNFDLFHARRARDYRQISSILVSVRVSVHPSHMHHFRRLSPQRLVVLLSYFNCKLTSTFPKTG